ncbi:hypothetical protein [Rhizobium sp. LjRoot258]|uniref:hypothetical protein n=1 Tax=Rhizobium sp. LjRoot258 TaxID=3342299 RepID=UPI003ECE721C
MTPAIVIKIPDVLADRYKGCGTALAAIKDETIVDLVYIRDILPDADDSPEGLFRLARNPDFGSAAAKLCNAADGAFAGMVSTWEFTPIITIERGTRPKEVLLDPGNEGEPGTLWTQDEANSAWKTELRVAENSFDIVIADGHPQWEDVAATCEVFIRRDGNTVPIHRSDERNWMEARRIATVAMRVANAARGA